MVEKSVVIKSSLGLHAKSAAILVQSAARFKSHIWIAKDEKRANAKSVMGLMSLALAQGMEVLIVAEGEDETEAANTIREVISSGMNE